MASVRRRIMLVGPSGQRHSKAVYFQFATSNNDAEYEALLAGLRETSRRDIKEISICNDSQIAVGHVTGEFQAHNERMKAYLAQVLEELKHFDAYEMTHILRDKNSHADALSRLGGCWNPHAFDEIPI